MSDYTEAVESELRGIEHVSVGRSDDCPICDDSDDAAFSWSACDGCGSTYGGDRYPGHGFIDSKAATDEMVHLDLCVDCVQYIANGDEPAEWRRHPER